VEARTVAVAEAESEEAERTVEKAEEEVTA
jgi:hypothetical protein